MTYPTYPRVTPSAPPKYWIGEAPDKCELCPTAITDAFVDGASRLGWCYMCLRCHSLSGNGLGEGKGQKYELQEDGSWLKTGG